MINWIETPLKDLVEIETGKKDANEGNPDGIYRFYTCAKDYSYIDNYSFDKESILISGNGAYVGYVHYFNGKYDAYQRTYILSNFKINVSFLYHFLSEKLKYQINKEKQDTATPYITRGTLAKFKIFYPEDIKEQTAIASILSKVDEAIAATENSIKATERLKKALMQNLLTGKLKPDGTWRSEDEFYIDEKFGKIPIGWEVKSVNDVSHFVQYGLNTSSSEDGKVPMFRMNNIIAGKMVAEPMVYINISASEFQKYKLEKGDILFNRTNSMDLVGKVGIFDLDGHFVFASYLIRIRVNNENDANFINYCLNSYPIQCSLRSKATPAVSQANINAKSLRNTLLIIPKCSVQKEISFKIKETESIISSKQAKIKTLERLKKSLMQNLLTGKVRVDIEKIEAILKSENA